MSHQPSLRKRLIALISEVDFKVHHPLLPPLSSPMMYTVLLEGAQSCGSQSLECLMPVVSLFILLAPPNNTLERTYIVISLASQKVVPQVFLGVPWSGQCWLSSLWSALPNSVVLAHWWHLVFLQLLRLSTSEDNKLLLFESIFVVSSWLEHCGSWDGLAVMAAPLLYLTSGSRYSFPCFALERGTRNLMDHPVPEVSKPVVHHLQRGEKIAKYYQSQACDLSSWVQKAAACTGW